MLEDVNNSMYIELDCLIDTRLGMLYDIDKELAGSMLKDKSYLNRIKDRFDYIDNRVFKELYKTRDRRVLQNASPTNIIHVLKEYNNTVFLTNATYNTETKLYLNVYPYKLFDKETETLRLGLSVLFDNKVDIEVVYMAPEDVTASWVKNNVGIAVMYYGMDWLDRELINGNLLETPIPDIGLVTPNLVNGDIVIDDKQLTTFYNDIVENMAPYISITFLPAKDFSILNVKK